MSNKMAEVFNVALKLQQKNPELRLGQAIYNCLPKDLSIKCMDFKDHQKWYNSTDTAYCIDYFWDMFSEEDFYV